MSISVDERSTGCACDCMTREEYGRAYQQGLTLTIRFLTSRGVTYDAAQESAQAAWVKGWEHLGQLRDPSMMRTWMNTIALNIYRAGLRREPLQTVGELPGRPGGNLDRAIDASRILNACTDYDRLILERHYLDGFTVREIAEQHGWTETAVRLRLFRARRTASRRITDVSFRAKRRTPLRSED